MSIENSVTDTACGFNLRTYGYRILKTIQKDLLPIRYIYISKILFKNKDKQGVQNDYFQIYNENQY